MLRVTREEVSTSLGHDVGLGGHQEHVVEGQAEVAELLGHAVEGEGVGKRAGLHGISEGHASGVCRATPQGYSPTARAIRVMVS